ncbi:MAG: cytochrome c [Deltaproteobacteria bacterium]|nr:cytochrome c [Deltaproteobacteria bacterium]
MAGSFAGRLPGHVARTAVALVLVTACGGGGSEGPPPRYAEAPPEQRHASPPLPPVPEATAAPDGDGGLESGGGPEAAPDAADAAAAMPEAAGMPEVLQVLSATGPMTQEQWNAMLALGRRKFNGICAGCHGTGIGPRLAGRRKTAAAVRRQVRQGAGEMRPISTRRLSDDELEAVIVYLSTIRAVTDVRPPGGGQ